MKMKWYFVMALATSTVFAQKFADNPEYKRRIDLLDGEWTSVEGKYEISDVDVQDPTPGFGQDEIATFYFTRRKALGRDDGGNGERRFREGDRVICQGVGFYDPEINRLRASETCPSHSRGYNVVATLTLKLDREGNRTLLNGERSEQYSYMERGVLKTSQPEKRVEVLRKDREEVRRRWRRGPGRRQ